jgi:uncharacterized damage-inducible protein DinB
MTLDEVRTLIDYNYWARDRMLDAVQPLSPEQFTRDMGNSFRSVRDTLAHMYAAEWIWYSRWIGESPAALPPADRFPDLAALRSEWRDLEGKIRALFDGLDDQGIARVIEYKSAMFGPGASILWQMLQHVVNHGSYHRGQVTTLLRQLGATPPKSTDLIGYYRERTAARTG